MMCSNTFWNSTHPYEWIESEIGHNHVSLTTRLGHWIELACLGSKDFFPENLWDDLDLMPDIYTKFEASEML